MPMSTMLPPRIPLRYISWKQLHPDYAAALPLYKSVMRKKKGPFRKLFRAMAGGVAASRLFPMGLRGRALKAWQAHIYAEAL